MLKNFAKYVVGCLITCDFYRTSHKVKLSQDLEITFIFLDANSISRGDFKRRKTSFKIDAAPRDERWIIALQDGIDYLSAKCVISYVICTTTTTL